MRQLKNWSAHQLDLPIFPSYCCSISKLLLHRLTAFTAETLNPPTTLPLLSSGAQSRNHYWQTCLLMWFPSLSQTQTGCWLTATCSAEIGWQTQTSSLTTCETNSKIRPWSALRHDIWCTRWEYCLKTSSEKHSKPLYLSEVPLKLKKQTCWKLVGILTVDASWIYFSMS